MDIITMDRMQYFPVNIQTTQIKALRLELEKLLITHLQLLADCILTKTSNDFCTYKKKSKFN